MPVSNNIGYRDVYDQKDGVIFDLSYEKDDDEVEYIEGADKGKKNYNEYY
jgi:hypothetical protein